MAHAAAGETTTATPQAPSTAGIDPAFLSALAHELRNPLAPLVNALFLLRAKIGIDTDAVWALDIVDRQVADLRALLDDTSDIARLLRGRLPRPTDRIAASDVAQAAANAARPLVAARQQAIEVRPSDAADHFAGDRPRLVRALSALLQHAGRAAAQADVIVLAVEASDPHAVTFVVQGATLPGTAAPPAAIEAGIGVAFADAVARWHGGLLAQRTDDEGRLRCELRVPRAS